VDGQLLGRCCHENDWHKRVENRFESLSGKGEIGEEHHHDRKKEGGKPRQMPCRIASRGKKVSDGVLEERRQT